MNEAKEELKKLKILISTKNFVDSLKPSLFVGPQHLTTLISNPQQLTTNKCCQVGNVAVYNI